MVLLQTKVKYKSGQTDTQTGRLTLQPKVKPLDLRPIARPGHMPGPHMVTPPHLCHHHVYTST